MYLRLYIIFTLGQHSPENLSGGRELRMKGLNMSNTIRSFYSNDSSAKQVIYAFAKYNGSDSASIKQTLGEDTIGTLNGCIATIDFENALCRDLYNGRNDLTDAITAGHLRRNCVYGRDLTCKIRELINARGTLAAYKVSTNEAQNQRNRNKTTAKHAIQLIKSSHARTGKGVNCVVSGDQASYSSDGVALLANGATDSLYVLFDANPIKAVRDWLRAMGFKTGGTNQLWYRDGNSTDLIDKFATEYAVQFAKGLKGIYSREGSALTKKAKKFNAPKEA